jgi:hypothetical protein
MTVSNRKVVMSHPFVFRTKRIININNSVFVSCSALGGSVTYIIVKEAVVENNFQSQVINILPSYVNIYISKFL